MKKPCNPPGYRSRKNRPRAKAYDRVYEKSPRGCYGRQRENARKRGVVWLLTFEEWLVFWGEDISRRGKGAENLVMARLGDTGPYATWNIKKVTHSTNDRERNRIRRERRRSDGAGT